jgi:hypothetical protein
MKTRRDGKKTAPQKKETEKRKKKERNEEKARKWDWKKKEGKKTGTCGWILWNPCRI